MCGVSQGSRAVVHLISFRKYKQASKPSLLSLIIYTAEDRLLKRNRGFVFGTRVDI